MGTFRKKELRKKKQEKREEKLKRKEERRANASGSFADMIAYVDENGVITDTPPIQTKKEEMDLDSILISTPKKEFIEEKPLEGRVEHFNSAKGYGFIKNIAGVEKYFFHISNAPSNIAEGNMITFELERSARGMNAVQIALIQ